MSLKLRQSKHRCRQPTIDGVLQNQLSSLIEISLDFSECMISFTLIAFIPQLTKQPLSVKAADVYIAFKHITCMIKKSANPLSVLERRILSQKLNFVPAAIIAKLFG